MRRARKSLIKLLLAAGITALVYVLIVNGLRNPVEGHTSVYRALFSDVSGLRVGADIRRQGVQVGKVTSIAVSRDVDANVAEVGLELSRDQPVTTATHLGVKYQNLTGARYVDLREDDVHNPQPITEVPLSQTTGSFDITTLFQGLAPVLRTLDDAEINNLTDKVGIFLNGDGAGAADLIDSIRSLAATVDNKQQVISTIVDNLSGVARKVHGRSQALIEDIRAFQLITNSVMPYTSLWAPLAEKGPNFFFAINRLLWDIGARKDAAINNKFDVLRANLYRIPEFFERMPGAYRGLQSLLKQPGSDLNCTNGQVVLPPMVKVFLGDEQVVLCNR
ncbi:hypothetical protein BOO86_21730 [Mycobacterium sp. CBMA 234]|uniref:MlaD family protein n=1 Tax=Mycolicibacterium sp. CBMA 234 TaxID=1918495 RepID=UPI0012DF3ABB|nr:MlaD family protein [Mycolicibacterium sp. CBMA 234]MUL67109.1 hypothetical protein [Mycolicibacterium sp. CBMA 234]